MTKPSELPPSRRHPAPQTIGDYLIVVGELLKNETKHDNQKTHCRCLACSAERLAQIGWPAATTGDGRRGNPELTSVEAAATTDLPYAGIDDELHKRLRVAYQSVRMVQDIVYEVRKRGTDNEQTAGLGHCVACEHFANPRKNPRDRLVAGFCPACDTAWRRWLKTNPDGLRPDFVRHRKQETAA